MASMYDRLPPDFFEASLRSTNPLSRYYHGNRYAKIRRLVSHRFGKGMKILDMGSGSSSWNTGRLPVMALDQNRSMLEYGAKMGYNSECVVWNISKPPLPFSGGNFDIVVISEVLEHLEEPGMAVAEAGRVLKKGGLLVVTVPLDTPLSLWRTLFGLECFVIGDLLGNEYYRNRCGHIWHFSVESLCHICEKNGFRVVEKDITLMNIGIAAHKR